jgi:hypothetical protein
MDCNCRKISFGNFKFEEEVEKVVEKIVKKK